LQSAQEPVGGSEDQFARLIREDYDKYARLVISASTKADSARTDANTRVA